uniref:Nucleotide-diphospho-sugar transferase domain-containing protein n=1 Tax=Tetradesmus obliquus TaxID=3088 RepID=A0A383W2G0_TETOB|eukprot:jgi/Sobl393_1/515/SZX71302.1
MDDSTGKGKMFSMRERHQVLLSLFAVGMCAGIIISERLYISSNREDILRGTALPNKPRSARSAAAPLAGNAPAGARSAAQLAGNAAAAAAAIVVYPKDAQMQALEQYLLKIAPSREVLVGVSNVNPLREGMLGTFLKGVQQAGVSNYLVVALDEETERELKFQNINVFYMPMQISKSQADTGANHAVSALKFGILKKFLQLGWAVLLSDIDICVLQDPFKNLYRDHDLEGMSDGFDPMTAYGQIEGFDDPSMGWARFAQKESHFNLNSGLFYLAANPRTVELMQRLETRLSREKYWDQTAYNEEIFFLSHDNYRSPGVSVRVMSIYKFMNSKVLFKDIRHRAAGTTAMPVMVHINYHPDKHERMKAVFAYYLDKDMNALKAFPGGSEKGT